MARCEFSAKAAAVSPKREREKAVIPIFSSPSAAFKPSSTSSLSTRWAPLAAAGLVSANELDLDFTLPTGQSFRWRKTSPSVFTGVVGKRLVQVSQREEHLEQLLPAPSSSCAVAAFRVLVDKEGDAASKSPPSLSAEQQLADYFNARVSLSPLATQWAASDNRWAAAAAVVRGARVLRQPPLECLLSFICSSNNSIGRITGMVEHLARRYGTLLASAEEAGELLREEEEAEVKKEAAAAAAAPPPPTTPGKPSLSRSGAPPAPRAAFYSFPTLDQLRGRVTEQELREAGFGYRAKYVVGTVEALSAIAEERREERRKKKGKGKGKEETSGGSEKSDEREDDFLLSLRSAPEEEALRELAKLPGVGPKVAACVALFSLDKHAVVPVDTHVWQLAGRHYLPSIRNKPFSPAAGDLVSAALKKKFGPFAGWAHNALFIAELPGVRDKVAEAEKRAAREEKKRKEEGNSGRASSRSSSDDDSSDESSESDVEEAPPATKKRRNTAAARAAEAAARFNKIRQEEEAGAGAAPRTPGGKQTER